MTILVLTEKQKTKKKKIQVKVICRYMKELVLPQF